MRVFSERDVFLPPLPFIFAAAGEIFRNCRREKKGGSKQEREEGQTDWRYDMNGNASSEKLPDTDLANFHRLNGEWREREGAAEKWLLPPLTPQVGRGGKQSFEERVCGEIHDSIQ